MSKYQIKAVLFDLGETLLTYGKVDTYKVFGQASHLTYDYLVANGQPVGSFKWYMFRNLMSIRLRCLISDIGGRDFNSLAVMKKIGERHNFTLNDQQWQQLSWLWYEPVGALAKVESDIKDTLEKLKAMELKLGILSNTFVHSATLIKHLKQLGIWDFFDSALFSYDYKFRKPDKRIFLAAAESIGIKPENILFIGDRIKADVKGAFGCGMTAALKKAYTNEGQIVPNGVYFVENISQLPEIISEHNKV